MKNSAKWSAWITAGALTLTVGGCDAPAQYDAWEVLDVDHRGETSRYTVEVDGTEVIAYHVVEGESGALRVEDSASQLLFSAYLHEGTLGFTDPQGEDLEFMSDNPYAAFATHILLEDEFERTTTFRATSIPGHPGPAPKWKTVVVPSACSNSCSSERSLCEVRNSQVSGNGLMEPCDLEHSSCMDVCGPDPVFRVQVWP